MRVKKFLLNISDILIFAIIISLKFIVFNDVLKLEPGMSHNLVFGCIGSVLIISAVVSIFNFDSRVKIFIVVDLFLSLLLLTDTVYNRYFSDITSVALIKQAGLVGGVKDSVAALLSIKDALYFVDIIAAIPVYIIVKRKFKFVSKIKFVARVAVLLVLFAVGFVMSDTSVQALNKNQPGLLDTFYDKKYIVGMIGDLNFHAFDLYRYMLNNVFKENKISPQEIQQVKNFYNQKNQPVVNKYTGIMKGKNLIVVQLESFQSFVLDRQINGQEITPNLNNIAKDSLVFNNYYYETAWGGTSDAEYLSNVSALPATTGSVYYLYPGNYYDSMPREFDNAGYYTAVLHANAPGFWNRASMYKSMDFDTFVSQNNFNIDDTLGLGLTDPSFFRQSVAKIEQFKQPFYAFMITLSSHFPFTDYKGRLNNLLNVGQFEGQEMGDYLKAAKYTDNAIGQLVDDLKKDGLWDNSVVVFYGDHAAIPLAQQNQLAELLYNKNSMTPLEWFNAQKVVSMIHFPGDQFKGTNNITAGELDLYPTLANLFGIQSKYALGQDLLTAKDGFALTRDGNWADNNVSYLKSVDELVDTKTGKVLNKNDYKNLFDKDSLLLKYSDETLEHNLIKSFANDGGK